ncbi:MAG: hypothetical protein ACJLTB_04200 [Algoriphagus aquaeductus]|uniref:hypothetical protein n=1 Tax=Algoriphagus aquaeductus TaxID=475299 RepID=UPI0038790E96
MRKLLLIVILICGIKAESIAQLQKDSWMLEGGIQFGKEHLNSPDPDFNYVPEKSFSVGPKVGYFIADGLAFGLSANWGSEWTPNTGPGNALLPDFYKSSKYSYGGGVFVRKYVEIKDELSFYGELGTELTLTRIRVKEGNPPTVNSSPAGKNLEIYGRLGLQYLISPKIGVHLSSKLMHYQSDRSDLGFVTNQKQFRTGFILDPRFGFTFFF